MDITKYLKAGYPLIYVCTQEAERAIRSVKATGWKTYSWDCLRGITDPESDRTLEDINDPLNALKWLGSKGDAILIAQNFHHFMGSVEIIQAIQNSLPVWKGQGSCLLMAGPRVHLPLELEKYFTMLDFALPSPQDLLAIQQELGESVEVEANPEAVEAARGLTEFEAETAFALSLVMKKRFCPGIITEQKKQMIRRTGLMEFWLPVPVD
jgi:hypothetical protein